jgi:xylan 1,4-beta-xylosidase
MSYRNPIIPGFYPDPSVCRVGSEYYLATSSFTLLPGVPILRSTNLVDWVQIGNALRRESQLDLSGTEGWPSLGVFAPTLRHHDGRFWMITTTMGSSHRSFFVTSEDAAGPWSDPVSVDVPGIDPDIAWDAQGHCWVHFAGFGETGIARCRIDTTTGRLMNEPERTWSGTGLQHPEAPHLFERDGMWYLLIAEGGTERGHAVSVARGSSPTGPWEGCPSNPILSHRSTNHPVQNTGHADMVEAADGTWWMVLLGVRPRGITPGFHVLGRETFLTPVEWVGGWPVPDPVELEMECVPRGPMAPTDAPGRDDFDGAALGPQWVSVRRDPEKMSSLVERPGWLTLSGAGASTLTAARPVLVARRQQHHRCRVRSLVDAGESVAAGLCVWMDESSHYAVELSGDEVIARARVGPFESVFGRALRPAGPVTLIVEMVPDRLGPDAVRLGFEDEAGVTQILALLDGRYLSSEVAGGFLGRLIGMYAVGGTAAFDWFDYDEIRNSESQRAVQGSSIGSVSELP